MKIVVTGDTHLKASGKLPSRLTEACLSADLIIHTGDWKSVEVLNELSRYGEVTGVCGNIDGEIIQERLPVKQLLEIDRFKIGVVHGHGEKKTTERRAIEAFSEEQPDVIIFGHSHIPMIRYLKKQLLLNPGSPTDKRTLPYYSFAILTISDEIHAELVFFN
ncbi:metallophosphoesterase family protein [Lentibacillus amyloliquefaciens]|uniref:Phosphoesterase n=1 Tax=Lentibacillus amyloliquefaciens TaxID=1472767 RepID=A0A0U4F7T0_9BACI|nr:metallophosphoesterase family protein [Lentibacillus amyloliquefaciens]ALX48851.1 phosphodiesterase [Lentibacillus amyloliquefaciens]